MARALVVKAVGGGQARPLGVAYAAQQGGHAASVQRPGFAEVHKVQDHPLTYIRIGYFGTVLSWYYCFLTVCMADLHTHLSLCYCASHGTL